MGMQSIQPEVRDIKERQKILLNFVGYCDLASFQKVNPENEK
jgi:hypothetical protein